MYSHQYFVFPIQFKSNWLLHIFIYFSSFNYSISLGIMFLLYIITYGEGNFVNNQAKFRICPNLINVLHNFPKTSKHFLPKNVKFKIFKCRFNAFIHSLFLIHSSFCPPLLFSTSLLLLASIVFCLFFSLYISFFHCFCVQVNMRCVLWSECNWRIKRMCELWNISNKWACP